MCCPCNLMIQNERLWSLLTGSGTTGLGIKVRKVHEGCKRHLRFILQVSDAGVSHLTTRCPTHTSAQMTPGIGPLSTAKIDMPLSFQFHFSAGFSLQ